MTWRGFPAPCDGCCEPAPLRGLTARAVLSFVALRPCTNAWLVSTHCPLLDLAPGRPTGKQAEHAGACQRLQAADERAAAAEAALTFANALVAELQAAADVRCATGEVCCCLQALLGPTAAWRCGVHLQLFYYISCVLCSLRSLLLSQTRNVADIWRSCGRVHGLHCVHALASIKSYACLG